MKINYIVFTFIVLIGALNAKKAWKQEWAKVQKVARDYQTNLNKTVPFDCISGYGMHDDDKCIRCTDSSIPEGAKCSDLKEMNCAEACKFELPSTCCPRTCGKCQREAFKETLKQARNYQDLNQDVPARCAATNGEDDDSCITCTDPSIEEDAKCTDLNMMGCSEACEFNLPSQCCPSTCADCTENSFKGKSFKGKSFKGKSFKETLKKARAFRENLQQDVPENCAATGGEDSDSCIRCTDPTIEEGAKCAELYPEACRACQMNLPAKCCPGTCAKCAEQKPHGPEQQPHGPEQPDHGHGSQMEQELPNETNNDECAMEAFESPCDAEVMCPYVPTAQMDQIGLLFYCCPDTFTECMMDLALRCFPSEEGVDSNQCVGCMVNELDEEGNLNKGMDGCEFLGNHCELCDQSLIAMSCCLKTCENCRSGQQ